MPDAMTFWLTSALVCFNLWTVYEFTDYFFIVGEGLSNSLIYCGMALICLINFLLVFRDKNYQEMAAPRNFGFKVVLYIAISAMLVIGILLLQRGEVSK